MRIFFFPDGTPKSGFDVAAPRMQGTERRDRAHVWPGRRVTPVSKVVLSGGVLWRYWQGFVERTVCTPSSFLCRPAHSGGDVLSASVAHITTRTRPLARSPTKVSLSAMCIRIQTVRPFFSGQDDDGEGQMAHRAHNRNCKGTEIGSLLLAADSRLAARI